MFYRKIIKNQNNNNNKKDKKNINKNMNNSKSKKNKRNNINKNSKKINKFSILRQKIFPNVANNFTITLQRREHQTINFR